MYLMESPDSPFLVLWSISEWQDLNCSRWSLVLSLTIRNPCVIDTPRFLNSAKDTISLDASYLEV